MIKLKYWNKKKNFKENKMIKIKMTRKLKLNNYKINYNN